MAEDKFQSVKTKVTFDEIWLLLGVVEASVNKMCLLADLKINFYISTSIAILYEQMFVFYSFPSRFIDVDVTY